LGNSRVAYHLLMVEPRVLSPEQIAELAGRLAELHWSWSVSQLDRVVGELGWTVAAAPQGQSHSAVLRTGLPVDGLADLVLTGDGTGEVVVRVSDPVEPDTPQGLAFSRDAFAQMVRAVTTAIGEPADRHPGEAPEVRWPASSGVLRVTQGELYVELALMSVSYSEARDARLAEPFDELSEGEW
jgi:hypothetical protein